ncbi:uncharacterized protein C2orf92 homolog [Fukomys damarensis]|uniref:uncharacterized protein C2orf92 homolog n=1 Tax=Fukomys damarensis TaxID=885580 RepID=UPI00053FDF57|nr:uncharacterized protein C2orf92 homolog [Fukomys damarensis]
MTAGSGAGCGEGRGLLSNKKLPERAMGRCQGSNSIISSSTKSMEKGVAKILDDILHQAAPEDPTVAAFEKAGYFQENGLSNSEFASSSNGQDDDLKKLLDDILHQAAPEDTAIAAFEKASTAAVSGTRKDPDERTNVPWNSEEPDYFLDSMDNLPDDDRISEEKRNRDSSLIHKAVTVAALRKSASPDLPCGQLLHFLQKNITSVAFTVAAILGVMVLLVFLLTFYVKRRQSLHPPANMTYNIFILDEKSWWQKPQESVKKFAEKHKHLKYNSCV